MSIDGYKCMGAVNTKNKRKFELATLFYALCFVPISLGSVMVNYLYLLFFLKAKYQKITNPFILLFFFYLFFCLVFGVLVNDNLLVVLPRMLISFSVVLLALSPVFLYFDKKTIENLINGVLFTVFCYSVYVLFITIFVLSHGATHIDTYALKTGLRPYVWGWPQSFLPMLVFSIFIILKRVNKSKIKYTIVGVVVFSVIILSATRSALLSISMGLMLLGLFSLRRLKINSKKLLGFLLFAALAAIFLYYFINKFTLMSEINTEIIRTLNAFSHFFSHSQPSAGSDHQRIQEWGFSVHYLLDNASIFFGTGFRPINTVIPNHGSLDSGVFDLLFKMGLVGVFFWFYIMAKVVLYFSRRDVAIAAGVFSIFIFNFTDDAIQYPYCAFLIVSLFSFSINNVKWHEKGGL
jgi:hypothetical protein